MTSRKQAVMGKEQWAKHEDNICSKCERKPKCNALVIMRKDPNYLRSLAWFDSGKCSQFVQACTK